LVTPDEIASTADLRTRCWINGTLAYDLAYEDMQWKPAQLVSLVSRFMTLQPGTLILCGTGPRVDGTAPQQLEVGDVVRTEVPAIGVIENRCLAEVPSAVPAWHGSFERTATVRASPAEVWRQLTEKHPFEQWCGPCTAFDARPGGALHTRVLAQFPAEGEFISVEPLDRVSLRFGHPIPDIAMPPRSATLTFELANVDGGVSVVLRAEGIHPALVAQQEAAWELLLSRLSASCEGRPVPDSP
jgi:uncharacterized protein YndB with AHSA1/START domain